MKLGLAPVAGLAALSVLTLSFAADAKLSRDGEARVAFTATGPGGLKFEGTTGGLEVADDGQNVTVTVPLAGLSTGIDLRDRHMKEKYLDVAKYPTAELVVPRARLALPDGGEADAQGTMKLHGQSKTVTFHYAAKKVAAGKYAVDAKARLNMKDFGIDVPSYLGVTVKPEVEVVAKFAAADG